MTPRYCLGFAFDIPEPSPNVYTLGAKVALIRKTKPTWQAGHLNGIGGKIEGCDLVASSVLSGLSAMVREFREETGFTTDAGDWQHYHTMGSDTWQVECFRAFEVPLFELKTTTEEQVLIVELDKLPGDVLFNLRWLIPLALDPQPYPCLQVYR